MAPSVTRVTNWFKITASRADEHCRRLGRTSGAWFHYLTIPVPAFPTPSESQQSVPLRTTGVDPLVRVLRAYDRAIQACESFNRAEARAAIGVLRSALELDGPTARGFDALYAHCEASVEGWDFIGPARTLRALRAAWCQAGRPVPISPRKERPVS